MPPSSRIPPLLQPYVHLPRDESLLLLTSTLGASANWLLIRFLCDALNNSTLSNGEEEGHDVVLVSWMRDYEFWRQEARKGAGLDLDRMRRDGRFAFVDGLSGLCLDNADAQSVGSDSPVPAPPSNGVRTPPSRTPLAISTRGPPGRMAPARTPPAPASPAPTTNAPAETAHMSKSTPGLFRLQALDLTHLKTTVASAVAALTSSPTASPTAHRHTLIILDNPDLLLALNPTITPSAMVSLVLNLHMLPTVSHILTHVQSDDPLLSLGTPAQPLEIAQHNLLVKCAHVSSRIIGVRVLDTGVARDVSGVIRVTEQKAQWLGLGYNGGGNAGEAEESGKGKEFLYQVKGDGSVRVFERGAGGEG